MSNSALSVLCVLVCLTQSGEAAAWEAEKEADSQRLKRHQRVLDKQSRALLKLPNRKERSEVSSSVIVPNSSAACHMQTCCMYIKDSVDTMASQWTMG